MTAPSTASAAASASSPPPPARLVVRPLSATDAPLLAALGDLFVRDAGAHALSHPDYLREELAALPRSRHAPVVISLEAADGPMVAAAVLVPKALDTSRWGGLAPGWNVHGFRLSGNRLLTEAVDETTTRRLLGAVADHLRGARADFLLVEDLDQPSALEASLQAGLPSGWKVWAPRGGSQARLRINLPEVPAEYWSKFSKKTLSTFRRKLKKFGKTRLERITTPEQVPGFLKAAHEISLQTWQTRHLGLRIADDEASRRKLSALAGAGLLRCYLWYSDDTPAAFCVGNVSHGKFNYEEVGYATRFARFSPGQMLVVQMLEDLLTHEPVRCFDFGGGDAEYKRMFANDVGESGSVLVVPPTLRARAIIEYLRSCQMVKGAVRDAVARSPFATRVRQWVRYGGAKPGAGGAAGEGGAGEPGGGGGAKDDEGGEAA